MYTEVPDPRRLYDETEDFVLLNSSFHTLTYTYTHTHKKDLRQIYIKCIPFCGHRTYRCRKFLKLFKYAGLLVVVLIQYFMKVMRFYKERGRKS